MVKKRCKNIMKKRYGKGCTERSSKPWEIKASTAYKTCREHLRPFGIDKVFGSDEI